MRRRRLVAWTMLTSILVAVTVWTLLGPPDHTGGPRVPSRDRTASVR